MISKNRAYHIDIIYNISYAISSIGGDEVKTGLYI